MLQYTSSEVIIIQLQINLNSNIQLYGLGTNDKNMLIIEIKVSHCQRPQAREKAGNEVAV